MTASKLSKLTIPELQALKEAVEQEIKNKISDITSQVIVTKLEDGKFRFERKYMIYEAYKSLNGSWKVYQMEKSLRPGNLKRGALLDSRYQGGVNDIRNDIAFGKLTTYTIAK